MSLPRGALHEREGAVEHAQCSRSPGDVVVFRGDQRHSYRNPGRQTAIAYSVVALTVGR